jgi:signal transduction histidine kinase
MAGMITISADEWSGLKKRLKSMAMEKSCIQLVNSLMNRLSAVPGLENVLGNILSIVLDNLGGINIVLYYLIDDAIFFTDAYGETKRIAAIDDRLVQKVFETRELAESEGDVSDTLVVIHDSGRDHLAAIPFTNHLMNRYELKSGITWAAPLLVGSEVIGILKMEGMMMGGRPVRDQLQTFFNYAALVLKNEILSYTNLKIMNDRLQEEIEARREKEEELKDSIESALAANRELEAFSYSVSHDLRAPLRAVDGYAQILSEDFGYCLDAEGKRVCAVISESARNMGRLIDDLLSFSRIGRKAMRPSPVDMANLAGSIFFELTTPEERDRIDFSLAALPYAVGDPGLLRQVWMNLLGNAIKFSSKKERALIEVRAEAQKNEMVYVIRDNGAGFDMQYVDKLFGVFQRLHSVKEFEGTGVGLAIVQRIIQRHGGRVWGEGEPDKGARFSFTVSHESRNRP